MVFVLLLGVFSLPARASLGDKVGSVASDAAHLNAEARVSHFSGYEIQEMQAPTGTVVREFVSPAGDVFAVAWQGPAMPDMRQVLGTYFNQFSEAMHARKRHGGPVIIHEPGFDVEMGGHMRSFFGRAYVPAMLPNGVSLQDVK